MTGTSQREICLACGGMNWREGSRVSRTQIVVTASHSCRAWLKNLWAWLSDVLTEDQAAYLATHQVPNLRRPHPFELFYKWPVKVVSLNQDASHFG